MIVAELSAGVGAQDGRTARGKARVPILSESEEGLCVYV